MQNYYELLEISTVATEKDIKKSYHRLALKYHPDKCKSNEEHFLAIKAAYEILIDPRSRSIYDRKTLLNLAPQYQSYEEFKASLFRKKYLPSTEVKSKIFLNYYEKHLESFAEDNKIQNLMQVESLKTEFLKEINKLNETKSIAELKKKLPSNNNLQLHDSKLAYENYLTENSYLLLSNEFDNKISDKIKTIWERLDESRYHIYNEKLWNTRTCLYNLDYLNESELIELYEFFEPNAAVDLNLSRWSGSSNRKILHDNLENFVPFLKTYASLKELKEQVTDKCQICSTVFKIFLSISYTK